MILLDTHIWVWWVHGDAKLKTAPLDAVAANESVGLGVSVVSCWEVAKLVQVGRLILPCDVEGWMADALSYPGVQLLDRTPRIAIESTRLPGEFHRDPADQLLVATARTLDCPIVTADEKILQYCHVESIG